MSILFMALITATLLLAVSLTIASYPLLGLSLFLYFISWIIIKRITDINDIDIETTSEDQPTP